MEQSTSACSVLAFLIIECGMTIGEAEALTLKDPLYVALFEGWQTKIEREDRWVAMQSMCAASAMGGAAGMDLDKFRHYKFDKPNKARGENEEYAKWLTYGAWHSAMQNRKSI